MNAPLSLAQMANEVLTTADGAAKVALSRRHAAAWFEARKQDPCPIEIGTAKPPLHPARPEKPELLNPRDVPKIVREVDPSDLVIALAFAKSEQDAPSAEFLLENMSNRMANNIREEVTERGKVKRADGEIAFSLIVNAMRDLVNNGEIELRSEDGEEDE